MTEVRKLLDFRSDTVTRPTDAMREAMLRAPVGDDVLGDDPTVQKLEEAVARRLGKEAALYVPSGTMSNLIALYLHCKPGEEFIADVQSHLVFYEQAGYAQINGVAAQFVSGERGVFSVRDIERLPRPENVHMARTKAVFLENTHNRGGGKIFPYEPFREICHWARKQDLSVHLDGARLMNAVVATGIEAARWTEEVDTVSLCFSKGLGAPVGSILAGSREQMEIAHRRRKVLGGGMRQSGMLAAAALHAMEHHVDRLQEDHDNAKRLAEKIDQIQGLSLKYRETETNMVFFEVDPSLGTADQWIEKLAQRGLLLLATAPTTIRAVTHLDVDREDVVQAANVLQEVAQQTD
jgi:threonine aldolase